MAATTTTTCEVVKAARANSAVVPRRAIPLRPGGQRVWRELVGHFDNIDVFLLTVNLNLSMRPLVPRKGDFYSPLPLSIEQYTGTKNDKNRLYVGAPNKANRAIQPPTLIGHCHRSQ